MSGHLASGGRPYAAARRLRGPIVTLALVFAGATVVPGARGAAPTAPARIPAPRVALVPLAAFDSLDLIGLGAWSPRGARLALSGSDRRLYVVDGERPADPPHLMFTAGETIRALSWAPDGSWLALVCGDSISAQTLVAVPVGGGAADTLIARSEIWGFSWGMDGKIYGWLGRHRQVFDPPTPFPSSLRLGQPPPVVAVADGYELRLRHWAPGMGEEYLLPGVEVMVGGRTTVRMIDLLPDGSRYLVAVSGDTISRWLLVDGDGRTLLDLRRAGLDFQPTSISADGKWIAGFSGRWKADVGWTDTGLRLGDASGRWSTAVEGAEQAIGPQFSRQGTYIAYFEPVSATVRLGRLVIPPR